MADGGHMAKAMTPKAAEAFRDYVALGPDRSLRKLHARYREQTADKPPTRRFDTLGEWSATYGWQERIASAATERTKALLSEANEIDADSFTLTSRKLRDRLDYTDPLHLDALIKIRESVRSATAKEVKVTGADGGPLVVQFEVVPSRIAEETG